MAIDNGIPLITDLKCAKLFVTVSLKFVQLKMEKNEIDCFGFFCDFKGFFVLIIFHLIKFSLLVNIIPMQRFFSNYCPVFVGASRGECLRGRRWRWPKAAVHQHPLRLPLPGEAGHTARAHRRQRPPTCSADGRRNCEGDSSGSDRRLHDGTVFSRRCLRHKRRSGRARGRQRGTVSLTRY
jgi:hypothetical protein